MQKTLEKIVCAGAVIGALGFGCKDRPILSDGPVLPHPTTMEQKVEIEVIASGYNIKTEDQKVGRILFSYDNINKVTILDTGNYGDPHNVTLFDHSSDGSVDVIYDINGHTFLFDILLSDDEEKIKKLKERFEKADKIFAEYKTMLKDGIEMAEREWKEKYTVEGESPITKCNPVMDGTPITINEDGAVITVKTKRTRSEPSDASYSITCYDGRGSKVEFKKRYEGPEEAYIVLSLGEGDRYLKLSDYNGDRLVDDIDDNIHQWSLGRNWHSSLVKIDEVQKAEYDRRFVKADKILARYLNGLAGLIKKAEKELEEKWKERGDAFDKDPIDFYLE